MAAPVVVNTSTANWPGAYPLAFSWSHNATGCDALIVCFYAGEDYTYTPTCTFNGVAATLVAQSNSGGANMGTMRMWALASPATGSHTISIADAGNYSQVGVGFAVGLSGSAAVPVGGYDTKCEPVNTPAATSLTLAASDSTVLGFGFGRWIAGNPLTHTESPSATVLRTNNTNADFPSNIVSQVGGSASATDSVTWACVWGSVHGALIEVLGAVPSIIAPPLVATFTLGPAAVSAPQYVVAPPLVATFSLGPIIVDVGGLYPQVIEADPLVATFSLGPAHAAHGSGGVTFPFTLAAGDTMHVSLRFAPSASGARTGQLSIVSNATTSPDHVALSGTGAADVVLLRLSTSGNQIVDSNGAPVRLRGVNWFGAESSTFCPHGLWARVWTDLVHQIVDFGFNCVRLAFSDAILDPANIPNGIDTLLNPDLAGLTALEILDKIIDYGAALGVRFVLDHHRTTAGAGTDGWPPASGDGGYSLATWATMWGTMATRYHAIPAVCGFDPHNEPHNPTWATWAGYVEDLADSVHAIAPDWLCFCEGVATVDAVSYWWGGQLAGVADRPVVLAAAHKLVYSPHEYGQSVAAGQAWLQYQGGSPVTGWPMNLYAKWHDMWGYIFSEGIAPIWIGEFGGFFGYDGAGADFAKPNRTEERQWLAELVKFLNGDLDGNGTNDLTVGQLGMSFAYWAIQPNSGDTGGLIQDDWVTPQSGKLALLADLLTAPTVGLTYLHTSGPNIVDTGNNVVRLKSIGWYGAEQIMIPVGLWARPFKTITVDGVEYEGMLDVAKRLGFNCLRLAICEDLTWAGTRVPTTTWVDPPKNVDLFTSPVPPGATGDEARALQRTAIEMMDRIVAHCADIGLRIIFDMHALSPGSANLGKWYSTTNPGDTGATSGVSGEVRSEAQWIAAWTFLATRYLNQPVVCGFDLINEPHAATWDNDAHTGLPAAIERCANAVHAINPSLLIFVEGIAGSVDFTSVGGSVWGVEWGSNLTGVAGRPVALTTPNRVVYAPHEYGTHGAGDTPWLSDGGFPGNMPGFWDTLWGNIVKDGIAPLFLGEFGGQFKTPSSTDTQWMAALQTYLMANNINWSWWSYPDSPLINGIVNSDDLITEIPTTLATLAPLFAET